MKINLIGSTLAALVFAALSVLGTAKAATEPPKISGFAGHYSGTALLTQDAFPAAPGTTSGFFRTSKGRESGTLTLDSVFNSGGTQVPLQERYIFNRSALTYVLTAGGMSASGFGRARIRNKKITYQANISAGASTASVSGVIRRTAKKLIIVEQLATVSGVATFSYNLKRHGK